MAGFPPGARRFPNILEGEIRRRVHPHFLALHIIAKITGIARPALDPSPITAGLARLRKA